MIILWNQFLHYKPKTLRYISLSLLPLLLWNELWRIFTVIVFGFLNKQVNKDVNSSVSCWSPCSMHYLKLPCILSTFSNLRRPRSLIYLQILSNLFLWYRDFRLISLQNDGLSIGAMPNSYSLFKSILFPMFDSVAYITFVTASNLLG